MHDVDCSLHVSWLISQQKWDRTAGNILQLQLQRKLRDKSRIWKLFNQELRLKKIHTDSSFQCVFFLKSWHCEIVGAWLCVPLNHTVDGSVRLPWTSRIGLENPFSIILSAQGLCWSWIMTVAVVGMCKVLSSSLISPVVVLFGRWWTVHVCFMFPDLSPMNPDIIILGC